MRVVACLCALAAGCSFEHGVVPGAIDAPMTGDGPHDGPGKDMAGCSSFSTILDTCAAPAPMGGLELTPGSWTYDTDLHVLRQGSSQVPVTTMVVNAAAGPLDVLYVTTFTVQQGATLRATGLNSDRGLGIVATGAVQIDGVIDVSNNGAGARSDLSCGALTGTKGMDNNGGAGGGGGGAFQGNGGDGSKGNKDGPNSTPGPGGTAITARPLSPIGGCDGGPGGGTSVTNGGNGGDGGGAVYVASAVSISIGASGVIDAGGQGGREGGQNGDAGGGGGSGGMILLESKAVTVAGVVVANGGGGGEGNTNGVPGTNGLRSTARAPGGQNGDDNGGDGGDGGAGTNLDGQSTNDLQNGGGGGGGGGVGFIAIACPAPSTSGATLSPDFAAWP